MNHESEDERTARIVVWTPWVNTGGPHGLRAHVWRGKSEEGVVLVKGRFLTDGAGRNEAEAGRRVRLGGTVPEIADALVGLARRIKDAYAELVRDEIGRKTLADYGRQSKGGAT